MCLLDELDVLDPKLVRDDLEITYRIDVALYVYNLSIIEASHDLEDSVNGSDVRQESIAETSTSRGASRQTGDVVDCEIGRYARLWVVVLDEPVVSVVRHDHSCLFGVDGRVGKVGGVTQRALGECLEERRLADIGETDLYLVSVM